MANNLSQTDGGQLAAAAEWLEADGLGGFASGTVSGMRTRRYHALLLTAVTPPTGRFVLVNGFDAWVDTPAAAIPGQGLGGRRRDAQRVPTPSREAKKGAGHGQFSENRDLVSGTLQGEPRHVPEGRLGRHTSP